MTLGILMILAFLKRTTRGTPHSLAKHSAVVMSKI